MGEVHSALAYYWDNKEEIDQAIRQRLAKFDQMTEQSQPLELIEKLRQGKPAK